MTTTEDWTPSTKATTLSGSPLTWLTWLIGGQDWAQHDNSTWTADGPNVTFRVNDDFATMTGTLADGKLTGTGTNLDGLNFTWTAEPGGGTRVP